MKEVIQTSAFKRDMKKVKKRGKNIQKLRDVAYELSKGNILKPNYKNHQLTGNWKPCYECHIEPDWLLIYNIEDEYIELVRTGSHSDLFK